MNAKRRARLAIDTLETRVVPASILTYTDVDGDIVKISSSRGDLAGKATFSNVGVGHQLQVLNLTAAEFQGADVATTVFKAGTGDGLANIGRINATGRDLASVTIHGDLGAIDAGDGNTAATSPALKLLSVRSLGRFGLVTQGGFGDLKSDLIGRLGVLKVRNDIKDAFINVAGHSNADGAIGSVTIGGSLIGGMTDFSGAIIASGNVGSVKIGGDLQGGSANASGQIYSGGTIARVSIGGSVIGGSDSGTGAILCNGDLGLVKVGHNVLGGTGQQSGFITSIDMTGAHIGGSLIGGPGASSGSVFSYGDVGAVVIGQDVKGGSAGDSGKIYAGGKLRALSIGGSLLGGSNTGSGMILSEGDMGAVRIGHDIMGGSGIETGYILSRGKLARLAVGGSVIGGSNDDCGAVFSVGDMGTVRIGHDIRGGSGSDSGVVVSRGNLAGATIGGSLIGGLRSGSGQIGAVGHTRAIRIGHDVQGGLGSASGHIFSGGNLESVTVGGSVIGGSNTDSGTILCVADMGSVRIGHDLVGGGISGSAPSLYFSGAIRSNHRIASVFIGGSIIAGIDTSTGGELQGNASIIAGDDIGSIHVKGSLVGNAGSQGDSLVTISARGQRAPNSGADLAIGKITIGGRVEFTQVLAGYEFFLSATNADAQIGTVNVGGDWAASNLVAGAINLGADGVPGGSGVDADNSSFGDNHDRKIIGGTDSPDIISRIGSVTIAGQVFGTPKSFGNMGNFGFVAEQICALKIGGGIAALKTGPNNDGKFLGRTNNMTLHEIDSLFGSTQIPVPSAKPVDPRTIAYTDIDGDHVTVTISKPLLTAGNVNTVFKFDNSAVEGPNTFGQQLQIIDLNALATNGLDVTVTVAPGGGDRLANIGFIKAFGIDLGTVTIPGDLGQIDAGDANLATAGAKTLSVRSMGRLDLDTQPAPSATFTPNLQSEILGGLGSLAVKQDFARASLRVTGSCGPVTIGGSIIGGAADDSGRIFATNELGAVKIARDVQGGLGIASGRFGSDIGDMATVEIGGSLIGGEGAVSGFVGTDSGIGAVKIGHNVLGGQGVFSGLVGGDRLEHVAIGGSLLGEHGTYSGYIRSSGGDIGVVSIGHNLVGSSGNESGKIDSAGNIASVTVGGSVIGGSGNYTTFIDGNGVGHYGQVFSAGNVGVVSIGHDLQGGSGVFSGAVYVNQDLTRVTIGGSVTGGSNQQTGAIYCNDGDMGLVQIGHNLHGASGNASGLIRSFGEISGVTIGGSIVGGSKVTSGAIIGDMDIGPTKIGHDLHGGSDVQSGYINCPYGDIAIMTIGGSLIGGTAIISGSIRSEALGTVMIAHDVVGGSTSSSAASLDQTGYIQSERRIGSVTIGGSIIAGIDNSTAGSLTKNASIRAGDDIGSLTVKGNLVGNSTPNGISRVVISARGQGERVGDTDLAIGRITIRGRVEWANILAAYSVQLTTATDGVQVGAVIVGRDWIASNLVAGMRNQGADDAPGGTGANADNVNFGDTHDTFIGLGSVFNRIDSIVIGGIVVGTAATGDHFGFSSHEIGSFKSLGFTAALTTGFNRDVLELSPITGDISIREV